MCRAVQFVSPERKEIYLGPQRARKVIWISEIEIAERMRLLLKDHSAWRTEGDGGQFSLAGAQPKTAYYFDLQKKQWGIPEGSIPTTHIFKPATGSFDGFVENEHFCLRLAAACNFQQPFPLSRHFDGLPVIVVERYDRIWIKNKALRIHQEDMCQALSRPPQAKYQNQGGPSCTEIINLIRQNSSDHRTDEKNFVDSLILNWLILGTDAHAKNYSFLIGTKAQVRLAPFYDISSALPYPGQVNPRKAGMAMKIGGKYRIHDIQIREWEKFATLHNMEAEQLIYRIGLMATILPSKAEKVGKEITDLGIKADVVSGLINEIESRSRDCLAQLNG